uniref:Eukaryotic translation initiation factor 3 subunit K n=1 Tax=Echinococcus canadensis TaxID=519352 RepID=A0A915F046_9CEST
MPQADPKDKIHALLQGIEAYNPEHLPMLKKHLAWQIKENEYDFEANLVMLRLYQFNPDLFDVDAVRLILLKAIGNLPFTDLTLYKYLIHTERLNEEPIRTIITLGTLLETCQFQKFWESYAENKDVVGNISDWTSSVRSFIAYVIDTTYERISKSLLMALLDIKSKEELTSVVETRHWKLLPPSSKEGEGKDDEEWIFITNHEASVKSTNIKEKVTFDAMARSAHAFKPSVGQFFIQAPDKQTA